MSKLWVKLSPNNSVKVSAKDCNDIDDFIEACKKKLSPHFDSIATDQLSLSLTEGGTPLEPDSSLPESENNTAKTPLFISITNPTLPVAVYSNTKQKQYKKMSVEASCRKYFDALACKLALFYEFPWAFKQNPTIGDVIKAKEKNNWKYLYEPLESEQMTDNERFVTVRKETKCPRLDVALPELFTTEEWDKVKELNKKTNDRIHDAALPTTRDGKRYIILPHSEFSNPKTIAFFKSIGVKGQLFAYEDDLLIKDEDNLSGSSASEKSNSPNI
jgi:hypothetical protein